MNRVKLLQVRISADKNQLVRAIFELRKLGFQRPKQRSRALGVIYHVAGQMEEAIFGHLGASLNAVTHSGS